MQLYSQRTGPLGQRERSPPCKPVNISYALSPRGGLAPLQALRRPGAEPVVDGAAREQLPQTTTARASHARTAASASTRPYADTTRTRPVQGAPSSYDSRNGARDYRADPQQQQQQQYRPAGQPRTPSSRGSVIAPVREGAWREPQGAAGYGRQQSPERQRQPVQPGRLGGRTAAGGSPLTDRDHALKTGLALTWLGTNSGSPTVERNVSCTLVRLPGAIHMVDCGEGTHRQLLALGERNAPLHEIDGIYITHLHGDHCFGLGAALALLDGAKARRQQDPARRRHHIYGPPGLAELLRASLVVTGLARRLTLPLEVTELVAGAAAAHPLQQVHVSDGRGGTEAMAVRRLAARRVADVQDLKAAADSVAPRLSNVEDIWRPPHWLLAANRNRQRRTGSGWVVPSDDDDSLDTSSTVDDDEDLRLTTTAAVRQDGYGRRPNGMHFLATDGLVWELQGCAGVTVRAAQLQHRVPCWGYAFKEVVPYGNSTVRRKAVVLGDTVSSRPMAPLAAAADVLAHEATFSSGMEEKARIAQHSTGWMAGQFAAAVGARALVLTHFSSRYREWDDQPQKGGSQRAADEVEAEEQSWAVAGLVREAAREFGRPDAVYAASDFHTFHVPPRRPQQEQQQQQ